MTLSVEARANSGFTVDENDTTRIAGIELDRVVGLLADDADPVGLTVDDLRLLGAMGDSDGLGSAETEQSSDFSSIEARAREVALPREKDLSGGTVSTYFAAHYGINAAEFESVTDLEAALDDAREEHGRDGR